MGKINLKKILRIIGINLVLIALLYGLVTFNKEIVRPAFHQISFVWIRIIIGSFPNFIAAYIISLSLANAVLINKPKHSRIIVNVGSMLVFTILAIEEIMPMWGASTYYDAYDIFASGLGSILSIITFELLARKAQ